MTVAVILLHSPESGLRLQWARNQPARVHWPATPTSAILEVLKLARPTVKLISLRLHLRVTVIEDHYMSPDQEFAVILSISLTVPRGGRGGGLTTQFAMALFLSCARDTLNSCSCSLV